MKDLMEEIERRHTFVVSERDALQVKVAKIESELRDAIAMVEHWKKQYENKNKKWTDLMRRIGRDLEEVGSDDKILDSVQ